MVRMIYKYPLELKELQILDMYEQSEIIGVQIQDNEIVMWALVDNEKDMIECAIKLYGTGHTIRDNINDLSFIGTVQLNSYVWHLFLFSEEEDSNDNNNGTSE